MADAEVARKLAHVPGAKHVAHVAGTLVDVKHRAFAGDDAGGILPAVLEQQQPVVEELVTGVCATTPTIHTRSDSLCGAAADAAPPARACVPPANIEPSAQPGNHAAARAPPSPAQAQRGILHHSYRGSAVSPAGGRTAPRPPRRARPNSAPRKRREPEGHGPDHVDNSRATKSPSREHDKIIANAKHGLAPARVEAGKHAATCADRMPHRRRNPGPRARSLAHDPAPNASRRDSATTPSTAISKPVNRRREGRHGGAHTRARCHFAPVRLIVAVCLSLLRASSAACASDSRHAPTATASAAGPTGSVTEGTTSSAAGQRVGAY